MLKHKQRADTIVGCTVVIHQEVIEVSNRSADIPIRNLLDALPLSRRLGLCIARTHRDPRSQERRDRRCCCHRYRLPFGSTEEIHYFGWKCGNSHPRGEESPELCRLMRRWIHWVAVCKPAYRQWLRPRSFRCPSSRPQQ